MARTRGISVEYGATVNLGNFESIKVSVMEEVVLDADDDSEHERRRLVRRVKQALETEVLELREMAASRAASTPDRLRTRRE